MAVNTRTEYTLRALLTIMEKAGDPISAAEICKIESLPKKYIEHLLAGLKNAEVVHSLPGSKGGYILAKEASRINLFDIMKAVEDVAWELSCTQRGDKYCRKGECGLDIFWNDLTGELHQVLKHYTLDKIYAIRQKRSAQ